MKEQAKNTNTTETVHYTENSERQQRGLANQRAFLSATYKEVDVDSMSTEEITALIAALPSAMKERRATFSTYGKNYLDSYLERFDGWFRGFSNAEIAAVEQVQAATIANWQKKMPTKVGTVVNYDRLVALSQGAEPLDDQTIAELAIGSIALSRTSLRTRETAMPAFEEREEKEYRNGVECTVRVYEPEDPRAIIVREEIPLENGFSQRRLSPEERHVQAIRFESFEL
jgi:hypothetical protein